MARRLERERLVVLFAARDGEARQFQAPGLPELRLGGWMPRLLANCWPRRSARSPRRFVIG